MPLGAGGKSATHFNGPLIVGDGVNVTPVLDGRAAVTETTAGAVTYSAANIFRGLILRDPNGAGRADLFPTATQLRDFFVNTMNRGPVVGSSFRVHIRNTADAAETITMTTNTGLTLSGTMTIAQLNAKDFLIVFTNVGGTPTATIYSLGTVVF